MKQTKKGKTLVTLTWTSFPWAPGLIRMGIPSFFQITSNGRSPSATVQITLRRLPWVKLAGNVNFSTNGATILRWKCVWFWCSKINRSKRCKCDILYPDDSWILTRWWLKLRSSPRDQMLVQACKMGAMKKWCLEIKIVQKLVHFHTTHVNVWKRRLGLVHWIMGNYKLTNNYLMAEIKSAFVISSSELC